MGVGGAAFVCRSPVYGKSPVSGLLFVCARKGRAGDLFVIKKAMNLGLVYRPGPLCAVVIVRGCCRRRVVCVRRGAAMPRAVAPPRRG